MMRKQFTGTGYVHTTAMETEHRARSKENQSSPDDEAPTGILKIDNATTTTTSSSVTLNLTATDNKGVVGYLASESSAPPSTDSTSWVSVTSTESYSADVSFTLSSGYGEKFVYVWFKDAKCNITSYGASITYSSQQSLKFLKH